MLKATIVKKNVDYFMQSIKFPFEVQSFEVESKCNEQFLTCKDDIKCKIIKLKYVIMCLKIIFVLFTKFPIIVTEISGIFEEEHFSMIFGR